VCSDLAKPNYDKIYEISYTESGELQVNEKESPKILALSLSAELTQEPQPEFPSNSAYTLPKSNLPDFMQDS